VTANNAAVSAAPEMVNKGAESDAWLIKVKLSNPKEVETLMDKSAYDKFLKESGH
jgi:glycine cleavage system H protein